MTFGIQMFAVMTFGSDDIRYSAVRSDHIQNQMFGVMTFGIQMFGVITFGIQLLGVTTVRIKCSE